MQPVSIAPLALLLLLAAASAAPPQPIPASQIKNLGSIEYGQTSPQVTYTGSPRFVAFGFNAKPGDQIDVTIDGGKGHIQAYLADSRYRTLAGGEAHFTSRIAPDSEPATYYILVTEANRRPATFTVDLERPSTAQLTPAGSGPDYLNCSADADCVAVARAGCCHNGYKDAVNAARIAAYQAAKACPTSHTPCPMFRIIDKRVAHCNLVKNQCEMVNPAE